MTMIAINSNHDIPIIISDLLITGDLKPERFILPSTGSDILEHVDNEATFYPRRLSQKVYILRENLVIAFAGSEADIKKFLFDIRLFCSYHDNLTLDQLNTWLQEYEFENDNSISYAILFADKVAGETTMYQILYGNWNSTSSKIFETTSATGSGAADFLAEASRDQGYTTALSPGNVGYALQSNIILLAKLLAQERFNLSNIEKHWGGGFEITYFDRNKFSKLDEFVYLIFQARQESDNSLTLPIPALLMHYKYVGELLLITVIDVHKGQTEETATQLIATSQHFNVTRFVVIPMDYTGEVDLGKLQNDTSFHANKSAMGYIFETTKGPYFPASFYFGNEMEVTHQHLESLKIVMDKRLNDAVVDAVNAWLNQP